MAKLFGLFFVIFFVACGTDANWTTSEVANPSLTNSGESSLFVDENGEVYLSWIDLVDDTLSMLKYAKLEDGEFRSPQLIAKGSDWFVNWADFPSLTKFPKSNKLLAHWLQKSNVGTYDYDIRVSSSNVNKNIWSRSQILHDDGVAAEHGFASIVPFRQKLLAVWLDGRNMVKEEIMDKEGHDHGHGAGAMTLRSALIDLDNSVSRRIELDSEVCECCQTDVAVTEDGPIVVYRNKSIDNIRDIYYTRAIGEDWTIPKPIFEDNWKISGCPVNGPRVDTYKNQVAIAWYSGADQKIKTVFSEDNGNTFSDTLIINQSETIGRVDVSYVGDKDFVISYMDAEDDEAKIKLCHINHDIGINRRIILGETSASRGSGFPRLGNTEDGIYVSYTYVDSTAQRVITKRVTI